MRSIGTKKGSYTMDSRGVAIKCSWGKFKNGTPARGDRELVDYAPVRREGGGNFFKKNIRPGLDDLH